MATDRVDIIFKPAIVESDLNNAGDITLSQQKIRISVRLATMSVTSIYIESETLTNYLDTNANPNTPYTPQYPGSPATKKYVDDNIPTKVSDLTNDSDFQTATQVNQAISTAISSAYKYKGSVANQAALPASGNTTGDVWNTEDTGMNYAWTGSAWDALGAIVDLSGKQDKLIAGSNIQIASDGKTISATDTKYTAGEGIEIGTTQDYSAMRGPCPEGFHVPLITEWQGLETIMRGLSLTTGDGWRINLHIPFAGERSNSSSSVSQQGDGAFYWSSSPYGSEYPYNAWYIYLNSGNVLSDNFYYRSYGSSIRGFKDIYVTPDNTWTVIQGTLGSAGIFWNQSEGLISITNGTTGYTIMDKNLGATTVYNNGDTLTQANMGNMYQWGNNYGFPSTGTITNTSSTQVDASAYGPGNYYNSDTFITRSTPQFDWSSVQNDNLRGGVTGIVTINNVITNTGVLSVNGQVGDVTVEPGITKIFELADTSDLTTAQAAYDWFAAGKAPIIKYVNHFYTIGSNASTELHFFRLRDYGNVSSSYWIYTSSIVFSISSGSVTAVSQKNNYIQLSSSAPSTDDKGIITLVI